jgi:hypothetical protein
MCPLSRNITAASRSVVFPHPNFKLVTKKITSSELNTFVP